jgi:hypothetical protein
MYAIRTRAGTVYMKLKRNFGDMSALDVSCGQRAAYAASPDIQGTTVAVTMTVLGTTEPAQQAGQLPLACWLAGRPVREQLITCLGWQQGSYAPMSGMHRHVEVIAARPAAAATKASTTLGWSSVSLHLN